MIMKYANSPNSVARIRIWFCVSQHIAGLLIFSWEKLSSTKSRRSVGSTIQIFHKRFLFVSCLYKRNIPVYQWLWTSSNDCLYFAYLYSGDGWNPVWLYYSQMPHKLRRQCSLWPGSRFSCCILHAAAPPNRPGICVCILCKRKETSSMFCSMRHSSQYVRYQTKKDLL